ncbi:MAG: type II toxin-antitoxin system death-on-curing family toxin [Dehalococcoidales bacterium]|nr:type II toxin-antitoxin system death-on-curing family toxin [Dehalococcoidales bacterium]
MKEPLFLTLDEVIEIHKDQIQRYGGHIGIRDLELLKSSIYMPAASFGGEYLHTDVYEMAAAYLFHIIRNHPFVDGNKRTGVVSALVFLILNGIEFTADEDKLEKMVVSVAEGKTGKPEIAQFFRDNSQPLE